MPRVIENVVRTGLLLVVPGRSESAKIVFRMWVDVPTDAEDYSHEAASHYHLLHAVVMEHKHGLARLTEPRKMIALIIPVLKERVKVNALEVMIDDIWGAVEYPDWP